MFDLVLIDPEKTLIILMKCRIMDALDFRHIRSHILLHLGV